MKFGGHWARSKMRSILYSDLWSGCWCGASACPITRPCGRVLLAAALRWQGSARVIKDDTACLMSTSTQCMWEEKRKPASKKAGGDKTALSARCKKWGQWGWGNFNLKMHSSTKVGAWTATLHTCWDASGPAKLSSLDHANTAWPQRAMPTSEKKRWVSMPLVSHHIKFVSLICSYQGPCETI